MRIIIAAALSLALFGCTDDDGPARYGEAGHWALSSANPVGPPVNCIEMTRIAGHSARDDRTIDFHLTDGTVLRNRLPYACTGLARMNRFSYRTALPRLCSVDLITLLDQAGRPGGSCGLGVFQPITIPPRQGALPPA